MGRREEAQQQYVEASSQYHDSWVSHEVTGNQPDAKDYIQSAIPQSTSEITSDWGKHLPE